MFLFNFINIIWWGKVCVDTGKSEFETSYNAHCTFQLRLVSTIELLSVMLYGCKT